MYPEFFWVSTLLGRGEWELQENFEKDALFYDGTEEWVTLPNTRIFLLFSHDPGQLSAVMRDQ